MNRTCPAALMVMCLALTGFTGGAGAAIERMTLEGYRAYDGAPNYFGGKLLTARDLGDEQDYLRSANRLIGDSTLPLLERFVPAGTANVTLVLDEAQVLSSDPIAANGGHGHSDSDFIVLDVLTGMWRGRLYLEERGEREAGIYEDLSGSFESFTPVPLPAMSGPLVLALLSMLGARHTRSRSFTLSRTACAAPNELRR